MGDGSGRTVLVYEMVTGGGLAGAPLPPSLAREGAAIRRALVADFAAVPGVRVVEPVDARCAPGAPAAATVARIIVDPGRPIDLAALIAGADAAVLVAPETGGELARLAARTGGRSLGATPAAVRRCADKQALADHLDRVGIPTPPTRTFAARDDPPRIASPSGLVVIKPVDGAGSVATFVLDADRARPPEGRPVGPAVIQPYRPGPALSASFLVDRAGRAHLIAVGRQEIAVDAAGRLAYAGGEVPISTAGVDLGPVRRAVESVAGLGGFVGVDFVAVGPAGAVEVIEINPRVTTSIVGLVRLAPPGTIARAWLDGSAAPGRAGPARAASGGESLAPPAGAGIFDPGPGFVAIRAAPPVRFAADGSVPPPARALP